MDNTQTKPVDVVKNADPLTSFRYLSLLLFLEDNVI